MIVPNWCECELKINANTETSAKDLDKFVKFANCKSSYGELKVLNENAFIPYPKKYADLDKKASDWCEKHKDKDGKKSFSAPFKDGFNSGGYEWCSENWGTKWGICNPVIAKNRICRDWGVVEYAFECAWSPPIPVVRKMAKMFPLLKFELKFWEGAMGFKGKYVYENGVNVVAEDKHYRGSRGG